MIFAYEDLCIFITRIDKLLLEINHLVYQRILGLRKTGQRIMQKGCFIASLGSMFIEGNFGY